MFVYAEQISISFAFSFMKGTNFCQGQSVKNMTVHQQENHSAQPLLFHLGRDYGEKYAIK